MSKSTEPISGFRIDTVPSVQRATITGGSRDGENVAAVRIGPLLLLLPVPVANQLCVNLATVLEELPDPPDDTYFL